MTIAHEEQDPAECVFAEVQAEGAGYVVRLQRADGGTVPVTCATLDGARELLRAMSPGNVHELLAELDAAQNVPTLH